MKAPIRRLIGYILASGSTSMLRAMLPKVEARAVEAAVYFELVTIGLKGRRVGATPLSEAKEVVKVTTKGREQWKAAMDKQRAKGDPLAKLPTLQLLWHLKRTPADWGRGYRILRDRWPKQFVNQWDFERQMRDSIAGTRNAAAGRGEARLQPVRREDMALGLPYIVTGGGGVWFTRGHLKDVPPSAKIYLVVTP